MAQSVSFAWRVAWVLLLGLLASPLRAQECPVPARGQSLTSSLSLLPGDDPTITLAQARDFARAGKFRPLGAATPSFGFVSGALWVSFDLPASDSECKSLLVIEQSRLDRVDVHVFAGDVERQTLSLGDADVFAARALPHRYLNASIDRPAGRELRVFLRVQSTSSVQLPIWLHTEASLLRLTHQEQAGQGLYFGILLALLLYNFAVMVSIREASYFYYVVYVASFGMLMLSFGGYGFEFLWPRSPGWQNAALPLSIAAVLGSSVAFARSFLDLDRTAPRVARLARLSIPLAGLMGLLALWPGLLLPMTMALNAAMVVFSLLVTVGAVLSAMRGFRPAYYFLLAWGLLITGGVALPLSSFGLLPRTLVTEYGLQFGSAAEMLLLSFSLAYRITLLRNERIRVEREARENLEQRVQERTQALSETAERLSLANQRLAETSLRDGLTGVFNRRYLDQSLPLRFADCVRRGQPIALLMIDIDHFKAINDDHGHATGDDCLREVARRLAGLARSGEEFVARYGGEEFAIVMPGADREQAMALAERLRREIGDKPVVTEDTTLRVTISLGVTCEERPGEESPLHLVRRADRALYEAKRLGRDQVCVA
ncbi:sensor domain-containing diguanylate cyclase [Arenimonas oryziterrae]|uniref:diguanylate cyclase n=1 Tax=Arenimonas oryziterrae DSM 21050 = YC6267 TaxID=1121015 RepID=A0A091AW01_9GAMM|nr:diguanylate cyclase [Arenimonas oryziterrae]KFN42864.1 hypothetical protein N789_12090 [Arenimonas oryziterrae DSM 21050 = YC6267]